GNGTSITGEQTQTPLVRPQHLLDRFSCFRGLVQRLLCRRRLALGRIPDAHRLVPVTRGQEAAVGATWSQPRDRATWRLSPSKPPASTRSPSRPARLAGEAALVLFQGRCLPKLLAQDEFAVDQGKRFGRLPQSRVAAEVLFHGHPLAPMPARTLF